MANLQERRDKSGKLISYSIRVHRGRGADGKQLKPWTATFEKECREGVTSDSRLRFEEYCNYVIGLKEQRGIKHSTIVRYRELTERLYPLPLGSAFGSGKSSGRKQQLMQTKRPETVRFRVFSGASGDTAFFKKHSNINGFRTPEQRNYLYSALLKPSISAAIARFISR
jgi:hypothetical protein